MRLRSALLALAFCFLVVPVRADTFDWSFSAYCNLCGPFVNQQGMPVDTGGSAATLFVQEGGTFITTDTPVNGALTITGITGARTTNWYRGTYLYPSETNVITGLIPPDPSSPLQFFTPTDNLLFPDNQPLIDSHGFAFTLNCGDCGTYTFPGIVQISGQSPGSYFELGPTGLPVASDLFTLSPAAVTPEPTTVVLFGIAGLISVLCRLRSAS